MSVNCDQGFQCRNSTTCLTWGQVCNNHAECPQRDDEDPEKCSEACNHLQCNDQQMCQPTPDGQGVCLCKNGYQTMANNASICQDIDECQLNPPPCSQVSAFRRIRRFSRFWTQKIFSHLLFEYYSIFRNVWMEKAISFANARKDTSWTAMAIVVCSQEKLNYFSHQIMKSESKIFQTTIDTI